jgi:uncharacterized protein YcnI
VALVGLAGAGAASAHVVASGTDAAQGGYGVVTLRVPTESDTASTTAVTVTLPSDGALTSVRTTPVPGWSAVVARTADQVPTSITWTADPGAGTPPGQYAALPFSAGPFPDAATLALPTTQTYSDGSTVAWDEPTPADGTEPEHPTPELALAASGTEGGATGVTAAVSDTASTTSAAGSDTTARWLGGAGLALGAVGLLAGVGALARARRS